jgi:N-methylhydantoinase B
MRAHLATIPDGIYESEAFLDSDAIDPTPLAIRLTLTVSGSDLTFDFSRSSPPCRGPLNSVLAATKSSVYIAVKHVFPDVPINAGCFAPLHVPDPEGTFLYAKYPRPVNGCSAEVTQRVIESVFLALARAIPERRSASSATRFSSRNTPCARARPAPASAAAASASPTAPACSVATRSPPS